MLCGTASSQRHRITFQNNLVHCSFFLKIFSGLVFWWRCRALSDINLSAVKMSSDLETVKVFVIFLNPSVILVSSSWRTTLPSGEKCVLIRMKLIIFVLIWEMNVTQTISEQPELLDSFRLLLSSDYKTQTERDEEYFAGLMKETAAF